jgi:hypothetical protein
MSRRAAALAALVLLSIGAASAQEAVLTISHGDVFGRPGRAAVRFPHAAHLPVVTDGCLSCHHDMKDGTNVLDLSTLAPGSPSASCAACHAAPRDLVASFHLLCIGCHEKARKTLRVTGPRTCGECHAWKVR